jgi:replicative DNA helicase
MKADELYNYEQAVISGIMTDEDVRIAVDAAGLQSKHFVHFVHADWFDLIMADWRQGRKFDLIFFTNQLRNAGKLDKQGGAWYVSTTYTTCAHCAPVIERFIDLIFREYEVRRAVEACAEAVDHESETIIKDTVRELEEIPIQREKLKSFSDLVTEGIERMDNVHPDVDIIPTGLVRLDQLSPLRKGDMPLIVGERKSGKSILALTIVVNVAKRGVPVAYYSLEDRSPKVMDRLIAGASRLPIQYSKQMSDAQHASVLGSTSEMKAWSIQIVDTLHDLARICASIKQFCAQGKCELAVIDYAQLVRAQEEKERRLEVEKVSRTLRRLAMELNIPIIVLCQLNKEGETRESKAFEMDATACWHIKTVEKDSKLRDIHIPWQRNGESNAVFRATFLGSIARFENYAEAL